MSEYLFASLLILVSLLMRKFCQERILKFLLTIVQFIVVYGLLYFPFSWNLLFVVIYTSLQINLFSHSDKERGWMSQFLAIATPLFFTLSSLTFFVMITALVSTLLITIVECSHQRKYLKFLIGGDLVLLIILPPLYASNLLDIWRVSLDSPPLTGMLGKGDFYVGLLLSFILLLKLGFLSLLRAKTSIGLSSYFVILFFTLYQMILAIPLLHADLQAMDSHFLVSLAIILSAVPLLRNAFHFSTLTLIWFLPLLIYTSTENSAGVISIITIIYLAHYFDDHRIESVINPSQETLSVFGYLTVLAVIILSLLLGSTLVMQMDPLRELILFTLIIFSTYILIKNMRCLPISQGLLKLPVSYYLKMVIAILVVIIVNVRII